MSGITGLLIGRTLCGRYLVRSLVGTGGMGAVFRARDERLGREVAVKVLAVPTVDPREQAVLRERFLREARLAAAIRHPNVVTIHDFGNDPELGLDFIVMELLPGEDVAGRIASAGGAIPVAEALEIVREAAMGLGAGHRAGLVHRDVKPGNVFLVADPAGGWEVKVLDFGIAQLPADTASRLTRAGVGPHTPRYAAPEQLRGEPLAPPCDVYSLALTGLEMLTGRYPEGVNTAPDDKLVTRVLAEVSRTTPGVTLPVAAVFHKALLQDPARRFPHADAFVAAVDRALTRDPSAATFVPSPSRPFPSATVHAPAPRPHAAPPPPPPALPEVAEKPVRVTPDGDDGRTESPPGPRRRRPAWAYALLAAVLLPLAVVMGNAVRDGGGRDPAPDYAGLSDPTSAGRRSVGLAELAREEAERARGARRGLSRGDTVWLVVLASYPDAEAGNARADRDRLREAGVPAGVGSSLVYPELRDGFVAVVAGPYTRRGANDALPRLRADAAPDAFVKRVTFRPPP